VAIGEGIASELADYKSATVVDATHLVISLKKPDALFLPNLSKLYILEQKLVTAHAGTDNGQTWLQAHDAGSGPYEITAGTVPVKVTRFAKFWDYSSARPGSFVFQQIAQDSTKVAELKTGQLDIALDLQTPDAKALAGVSGITLDWLKVPNTAYMFMNTQYGATKSLAVRDALRLAYDYSGGFSQIRGGEGVIENGPLPQTLSCQITAPSFTQNLTKAKSILANAGLSHLTLTLRFQPSISDQVREATLLQSDLKSIGVTLNLVPITFPEYLSMLSHPASIPELTLVQDTAGLPDAGVYLEKAYDAATIGSTNRAAYDNAAVNRLLAQAQTTVSETTRCQLYQQAETQINADAPSISMYTLWAPVAFRAGAVTGVTASQVVYPMSLRDIRVG
jgi:peptide/nickel transport system substrate-binding protein